MHTSHYSKYILLFTLLLFTACGGGGGGGDSTTSNPSTPSNPITTQSLNGQVVDGNIKDALVCLDINNNKSCDSNEPSAQTNTDGTFTLKLDKPLNGNYKVISIGGIDTATNQFFDGILEDVVTLSSTDISVSKTITPLTTLASKIYDEEKKKDTAFTPKDAKEKLATSLGLTPEQVTKNPLDDTQLFAKTQKLMHSSRLLASIVNKDDSDRTVNQDVFNDVYTKMALSLNEHSQNSDIDISDVIEKIKTSHPTVVISQDVNSFVKEYADAVETKINANSDVSKLASLQNSLETYTTDAKKLIKTDDTNLSAALTQTLQSLKDTTVETLIEDASSRHTVVIRSQVVNRGDTATNSFVAEQCGSLGGTAIYTGVDSNANGILDLSEQNDTPQVVCNGGTGTAPTITMNQLSTGDAHCADGGIELILGTQTSYLCNGSASSGGTTTPTPTTDNTFAATGSIKGTIDLSNVFAKSITPRSLKINARKVTAMSGGLWLTPAKVQAAIDEDKKAQKASAKTPIPEPIVKSKKVEIKADKTYDIPNVPSGEYSLVYVDTTTHEGTKVDDIAVSPGEVKTQDITETKANGSVTFKVASLSGLNLSTATIRLNELDKNTTTDTDGTAGFNDLPEGTYSLTVSDDGYVSKYIAFTVTSGEATDLQTIELNSHKGKLVGKVTADVVDDLANIVVFAKASDGSVYATLTDSNGNYTFPSLPTGNGYSIIAQANDFQSSKVDNITITNGRTSSANSIALSKAAITVGSIVGFARFADVNTSLDHAGLIVSIEGTDFEAITSRDGSFILNNITAGTYTLNFTDSNHKRETKSVKVVAGATTYLDNVSLSPKIGNLTGKVTDESGKAVEGAFITVLTPSQTFTTITDSSGAYTINGIIAGTHEVLVAKGGYGAGSTTATIIESKTTDITAKPITVSAKLLTGQINLQNTTDNSGATIALVGSDISSATTDANGNFTLYGVGAGNYQLQITKTGYITQSIPLSITNDNGYAIPYSVEMIISKSIIEGVATLTDKISSSGIKVEILGTDYVTYTDNVGKWAMNVAVGNYSGGIKFSKDLFGEATLNETATVVENGSYSLSSVSLSQIAQTILGTITVSGQTDFSLATLSVTGTTGDAIGVTSTINPNADGTFSISNLPLGTYNYGVTYPDGLHQSIQSSFTLDGTDTIFDLGSINLRTSYLTINNDATYTNSKTVTLQIGNSDASQMQITENGITSAKESFASSKSITLSDGDGKKMVTVNFFDANGNALAGVSDSIILDSTVNLTSLTHSGATTKGDTLHLKLIANETNGIATVNIDGLTQGVRLYDNGLLGDTTKDDGIYEADFLIATSVDIDTPAIATFTDSAGNSDTINSTTNVVLSTPPLIQNVQVTSNVNEGAMTISFITDELTTSKILYGISSDNLSNEQTINSSYQNAHTTALSNLTPNEITYFQLVVTDKGGNETTYTGESKLAPPPPSNLSATAGNNEVGISWQMGEGNYTVSYYNIYRSTNGGAFIKANNSNIATQFFIDKTVANDTEYSYKIEAVDESGNSSNQSEAISVTPLASLAGPTEITQSVISSSQIWIESKSPYIIKNSILVESGNRLTLSPGIELRFEKDTYLKVEGMLIAQGTEDKNITFISNSNTPAKGDWHGIWFKNTQNQLLRNVNISYSQKGIRGENSSVTVEHSLFDNNIEAVRMYELGINKRESGKNNIQSTYKIIANKFTNNTTGIYIPGYTSKCGYEFEYDLMGNFKELKITKNSFTNNKDSIIISSGEYGSLKYVEVSDNNITSNNNIGICIDYYAVYDFDTLVKSNTIESSNIGIKYHYSSGDNVQDSKLSIYDNTISSSNALIVESDDTYFDNSVINPPLLINNNIFTGKASLKSSLIDIRMRYNIFNTSSIDIGYSYKFLNQFNIFNITDTMNVLKLRDSSYYQNTLSIIDLDFISKYNYWGENTTLEMNSKGSSANINVFHDFYDEFELRKVDYSDWLTSAPTQVGVRTPSQQILDDTNISIQDGAIDTTSLDVDIVFSTVSATQMWISNSPNFTDGAWESFAQVKSWTLPYKGDGKEHTVFAKFKDDLGNESVIKYDGIIYQP